MDIFETFLHPPYFQVGKSNVIRFFKKFERYIAVQNREFDDVLKVNLLSNLLCDRAFDFFDRIPADTKQIYEQTKQHIVRHYDKSPWDVKI